MLYLINANNTGKKICCFVHIQYLYFLNIQEYEIPIVLGKKYLVLEAALN
jgi:hypothetical protein